MPIALKRVYEAAEPSDGERILVERLWPRGVAKDKAKVDHWAKDLAPSSALRRWFGHDPEKWPEFKRRYFAELAGQVDAVADLVRRARNGRVTFVYASREERHNNAVALREYIRGRL